MITTATFSLSELRGAHRVLIGPIQAHRVLTVFTFTFAPAPAHPVVLILACTINTNTTTATATASTIASSTITIIATSTYLSGLQVQISSTRATANQTNPFFTTTFMSAMIVRIIYTYICRRRKRRRR